MAKGKKITTRREDRPRKIVKLESVQGGDAESDGTRTAVPDLVATQSREVESRGAKMEQGKGIFESISEVTRSVFSLDAARKMAAVYIDTGEKVATDAIEFQAKANEWAKETPLQALLEVQTSMGRKLVELSADTARRLWRIEAARAQPT
jgi:hypothetical protein